VPCCYGIPSGHMCIRLWCNLHFQQSSQHSMNLIQIQRTDELGEPKTKPLWLVWVGISMPTLSQLWRLYFHRFAIDHWYRFAKQRLHWTLPNLSTPQQCERWSDLLPLMTWQLWLTRDFVRTTLYPGKSQNPS
jgi:hypothetical protein